MSKGLEALEEIKKVRSGIDGMWYLEELEEENIEVIEKELKALGNIKDKDIFFIEKVDKDYYLVVKNIPFEKYNIMLSKEEYDLLKEVLL